MGVIATTMNDAFQTGELVVQDFKSGELLSKPPFKTASTPSLKFY